MKIDQSILNKIDELYKDGIIASAIQFGSSVYLPDTCNDIDIAIIVKDSHFEQFTKLVVGVFPETYDISLILESEVDHNFYFGNHGVYLIEAFKNGNVLVGNNVFLEISNELNNFDIQKAVFERMREYVYIMRKSYFLESKNDLFLSRYIKFLRLSLFLNDHFSYQESMKLSKNDISNYYREKLQLDTENKTLLEKKLFLENLWKQLRKKYS